MPFLLAIDQGTTSTRALLVRDDGTVAASAQRELTQHFPQPGWVEHDPEEIWSATLTVTAEVIAIAGGAEAIAGIGITNQRETTILWERETGRPIARAIVWQDRRTTAQCEALVAAGHEAAVAARTGLVIDPYFSATKIAWLLDQTPGARAAAERGELAFGTVESFLVWRLTGGRHVTDATNAARTLLLSLDTGHWDPWLCELFQVPAAVLPEVVDCAGLIGTTSPDLFGGAIAITGLAGDQQAAAIGQACFEPGSIKSTYGTGCFILRNTGRQPVASHHRLLTTVGSRLGGEMQFALEGSIFVAGAAVQWLRDGLKLIQSAGETAALAHAADPAREVYLVPAFTGLGAPYWDPRARGAILGLTRDTCIADIVRAALEAVCFQTRDLLEAMAADGASPPTVLRVDGGMTANDWAMQFLADILGVTVDRPKVLETTAMGAAFLAGLGAGVYRDLGTIADLWQLDRRFEPAMSQPERERRYGGWREAVARVLTKA
ncbi:MAG: glycerol kinase [Alphaproteobacteria bacterium]|nr:MAG: glycerol kinase [Alphaproteobacteria bacterium]